MGAVDAEGKPPQDLVAIFHASFHPTKGNVLDWSLTADNDVDLTNVEFSSLPSGLHLVEQDVVYFTTPMHRGVCIFRRRKTDEDGQRGFRLSSLGVLIASSPRPRPWRHVSELKALSRAIYASQEARAAQLVALDLEDDWELARRFFEQRQARRADVGGAGDWRGWSHELDGPDADPSTTPTLHLPHLLRILGPAAFTVYKHVLGRKRVLIYTRPPVEAACTLCHVAADLAFMDQVAVRGAFFSSDEDADADGEGVDTLVGGSVVGAEWERQSVPTKLKGRCGEGVKVLGMVTLIDLDKMQRESASGTGWVACTTDAIFLEKPQHYDLLIDLTTASPGRPSRPTLHVSRPLKRRPGSRGPTHALHTTHTAWSDVKAWTELDRILRLDGDHHARCCEPPAPAVHRTRGGAAAAAAAAAAWPDVWRLYEDVCVLCAGLWLGGWRRSSGLGYEGCASASGTVRGTGTAGKGKGKARAGVRTVFTEVADGAAELDAFGAADAYADDDDDDALDEDEEGAQDRERRNQERRERQVLTTLALLQTFHAHTCFLLARLAAFLPPPPPASPSAGSDAAGRHADIAVTPHDLVDFDLGPLSTLDAQFVVWLAAEYGGAAGARVAVRRGWREVVRLCLGLR